jgi:hypothetical protein
MLSMPTLPSRVRRPAAVLQAVRASLAGASGRSSGPVAAGGGMDGDGDGASSDSGGSTSASSGRGDGDGASSRYFLSWVVADDVQLLGGARAQADAADLCALTEENWPLDMPDGPAGAAGTYKGAHGRLGMMHAFGHVTSCQQRFTMDMAEGGFQDGEQAERSYNLTNALHTSTVNASLLSE